MSGLREKEREKRQKEKRKDLLSKDTEVTVRKADDPAGGSESGIPGTGTNPATEAGLGGNKGKGTSESDHNLKK